MIIGRRKGKKEENITNYNEKVYLLQIKQHAVNSQHVEMVELVLLTFSTFQLTEEVILTEYACVLLGILGCTVNMVSTKKILVSLTSLHLVGLLLELRFQNTSECPELYLLSSLKLGEKSIGIPWYLY